MGTGEDLKDGLKRLGEMWLEEQERRERALNGDPNNGRSGTWVMEDDRHRVEVEAVSAPEAYAKARDKHSWWDWDVYFLGRHE